MCSSRNLKSRFLIGLFCAALPFVSSGCIFVPIVDSVHQMGVTEGDRQSLLSRDMKKYGEAISWSNPSEAMHYVMPESRPQMEAFLKRLGRDVRIVESKVDQVNFKEESREAEVDVRVKSYKVPYYVVNENVERQVWKFSITDGWMLFSAVEIPDEVPARG